MWRGLVALLKHLKYIKIVKQHVPQQFLGKGKSLVFCCLTVDIFKTLVFKIYVDGGLVFPAYRFPSLNRAIAPRSANWARA